MQTYTGDWHGYRSRWRVPFRLVYLGWVVLAAMPFAALGGEAGTAAGAESGLFARVGDQVITRQEYEQAVGQAFRQRFYHGRPPEDELDAVRQQVGEDLITRMLLLQEAERRGLSPDKAAVQTTLDSYDRRYAASPNWQSRREALLASLKTRLQEDDVLAQLEQSVRRVVPPRREELEAFYAANPDKFTEPARQRVSVILLRVDPSAPKSAWDDARVEAQGLVTRLGRGADFAELARIHSGDSSAEQGGDMGYLHQGMLTEGAQTVVDGLEVGTVSDPVRVLEGIAIFRVEDRQPARRRGFDDVQSRARELWLREQGDQAWTALKAKVRNGVPIQIYRSATPARPQKAE
jgi:hypothetical protein